MCKKFHAHSNAFWKSEKDKTHKNATSDSGSSSHIEIFSVGMKTDKNKTSPSSFQHLMTCYDPKLLQDTSKRTLNWCATAPSYKDILKEKTITRVEDIGVCPGKTHKLWSQLGFGKRKYCIHVWKVILKIRDTKLRLF